MNEREYATHYEAIPPFEENFRIGFSSYRQLRTMRPHWHEHLEFVYVTGGRGTFIIDGEHLPVARGDLIVADPNTLHVLLSDAGIDYHCLLVFPDFFREDGIGAFCFQSYIPADPVIGEIFGALEVAYSERTSASNLMKKSLVYRLASHLSERYSRTDLSPADLKRHTAAFSRIKRVEEFVAQNYQTRISTADLAAMFYLSENHFCRLFKRTVGISPLEYINEYRVGKAELLLLGTGLSVTEIAAAVGFDSANYFSRVFKRMRRMTPAEYRKAAR